MDAAYISALSALAGSAIGGLTSFATSWVNQQKQSRAEQLARNKSMREELYRQFTEEASRLYGDALSSHDAKISTLVAIHAMISRMRIVSSRPVVEAADKVAQDIIALYLAPDHSFTDLPQILKSNTLEPLELFSEACRAELQRTKWS